MPTVTTPASLLNPEAFLSPLAIDEAVHRALDEDLGRAGDITSIATIPEATKAHAILTPRQAGIIAGLPLAVATFQKLSPDISIDAHFRDGATVAAGVHVLTISGPARAVLAGERTALNFVGRLSGIATLTADYVRHTAGTKLRICCTRKTTPGLRALEKYAVRCGGGFNHRFGLDDAILIKDNHIAVAGGVRPVLERARAISDTWSRSRSRSTPWRNCARCSTPGLPTWCCSTTWISPLLPKPCGWRRGASCWKLPAALRRLRSQKSPRPASTTPHPAR